MIFFVLSVQWQSNISVAQMMFSSNGSLEACSFRVNIGIIICFSLKDKSGGPFEIFQIVYHTHTFNQYPINASMKCVNIDTHKMRKNIFWPHEKEKIRGDFSMMCD